MLFPWFQNHSRASNPLKTPIYRVAAAYAVVAWLLLQLFNNVAPILEAPQWVARVILLVLVMGFPVALLLAWVRELASADGTTAQTATIRMAISCANDA